MLWFDACSTAFSQHHHFFVHECIAAALTMPEPDMQAGISCGGNLLEATAQQTMPSLPPKACHQKLQVAVCTAAQRVHNHARPWLKSPTTSTLWPAGTHIRTTPTIAYSLVLSAARPMATVHQKTIHKHPVLVLFVHLCVFCVSKITAQ